MDEVFLAVTILAIDISESPLCFADHDAEPHGVPGLRCDTDSN